MENLYLDAVVRGREQYAVEMGRRVTPMTLGSSGVGYWIARYAARYTAQSLLKEASNIGVTAEQYEALRKVAAEVAYD